MSERSSRSSLFFHSLIDQVPQTRVYLIKYRAHIQDMLYVKCADSVLRIDDAVGSRGAVPAEFPDGAFSAEKGPPGTAFIVKNVIVMMMNTVTIAKKIRLTKYRSILCSTS